MDRTEYTKEVSYILSSGSYRPLPKRAASKHSSLSTGPELSLSHSTVGSTHPAPPAPILWQSQDQQAGNSPPPHNCLERLPQLQHYLVPREGTLTPDVGLTDHHVPTPLSLLT